VALKIASVVFGVIFGAYVAQKLQGPLGLDGDDDTLLFWAFFLALMAVLSCAFAGAMLLVRRRRQRLSR
jgi:multisubunit Na+/H+ antiporter MnhE subunit